MKRRIPTLWMIVFAFLLITNLNLWVAYCFGALVMFALKLIPDGR